MCEKCTKEKDCVLDCTTKKEEKKPQMPTCSICKLTLNRFGLCPLGHGSSAVKKEEEVPKLRSFETGATRDTDNDKLDYEGFLSPFVLERFALYMNEHRKQSDGYLRDSDNWQKGIPIPVYKSSLIRHMMSAWKLWRGGIVLEKFGEVFKKITLEDALCGILFNANGLLLELLKERHKK